WRQTGDVMGGIGAIRPLISMGPQAELEIQAPRHGLTRDELQHFEIFLTLALGQRHGAHVITWYRDQIGIGEMKIVVGHAARKIIGDAQRKIEPVEPARNQHVEIAKPELAAVEPGLVLDLAAEGARHAADAVGRLIRYFLFQMQSRNTAEANLLRQFEYPIYKAAYVAGADEQSVQAGPVARHDMELFRHQAGRTGRTPGRK